MPSVKCAITFTVSGEKNDCCMKLFSLITNGHVLNSLILPGTTTVSSTLLLSQLSFFLLLSTGIYLLYLLLNRLTLNLLLNRLILFFLLNRLIVVFASAYPVLALVKRKNMWPGVNLTCKNYAAK